MRVPVRIAADGATLAGVLERPVGSTALTPVVVTIGGSGPQDRDGARTELAGYRPFDDIGRVLRSSGIAVLRLDDRGTGESTGRFAGTTTRGFARDVLAALRWLKERQDVDGRRPILLGHSEGALIAMLAAAQDSAVSALVLLGAPSRSGRELARWQRAALVASDGARWSPPERARALARAEAEAEAAAAGDAWMREWFALDPREIAQRVRVPVLLLHGETDRQVPPAQAEELAAAFREARMAGVQAPSTTRDRAGIDVANDVTVRRFPSTDHLFLEDFDGDPQGYARLAGRRVREEVTTTIARWIRAIDARRVSAEAPRERPRERLSRGNRERTGRVRVRNRDSQREND